MTTPFQQAAQDAARELANRLDNFDDYSDEQIAAIILKRFAPLEAQLAEAKEKLKTQAQEQLHEIHANEALREERDEARREAQEANDRTSKDWSDLIEKYNSERFKAEQLVADNQRLRDEIMNIVTYCEGDICHNQQDISFINKQCKRALSTPPPSAVQDLELQARKAKALDDVFNKCQGLFELQQKLIEFQKERIRFLKSKQDDADW